MRGDAHSEHEPGVAVAVTTAFFVPAGDENDKDAKDHQATGTEKKRKARQGLSRWRIRFQPSLGRGDDATCGRGD